MEPNLVIDVPTPTLGKVSKKILVEKILLAKNDLHVMKRILYDTGRRTVARWPYKRG